MSASIVRATVKAVSRRKILSTKAALTLVSVSSLHLKRGDSISPQTAQLVHRGVDVASLAILARLPANRFLLML